MRRPLAGVLIPVSRHVVPHFARFICSGPNGSFCESPAFKLRYIALTLLVSTHYVDLMIGVCTNIKIFFLASVIFLLPIAV